MEFIVRVELHGADRHQYDQLHALMRQAGFSTTVRADDGSLYHLPLAEYYYNGAVDKIAVKDSAARCAAQVVVSYIVFVTVSNGWAAYGLQAVTRAA